MKSVEAGNSHSHNNDGWSIALGLENQIMIFQPISAPPSSKYLLCIWLTIEGILLFSSIPRYKLAYVALDKCNDSDEFQRSLIASFTASQCPSSYNLIFETDSGCGCSARLEGRVKRLTELS